MSEIKDYGEPWTVGCTTQHSVFLNNTSSITIDSVTQQLWGDADRHETARRIVACVNAFAGRDPAKLEGLLEASKWAMRELGCRISTARDDAEEAELSESYMKLRNALAAFEGGCHE